MHLTVLVALQVTMLPSSPAELLRHIQSDGYKQAQADQAQRVRGSFEVGPVCIKLPNACCIALESPAPLVPVQAGVYGMVQLLLIEMNKAS